MSHPVPPYLPPYLPPYPPYLPQVGAVGPIPLRKLVQVVWYFMMITAEICSNAPTYWILEFPPSKGFLSNREA